ncbi:MAG: glutamate--tRNA ligase [Thermostichales cyanobacterium BF4_bins_65]
MRVRIAPSPTGNLHIGTARTAVFNWLYARHGGGEFALRIEDTDTERSRPEYTENILESLRWLGLDWDIGPVFQSQRLDRYRQVVQLLLERGQAYYCFCTEAELEELRAAQKAAGKAPRYDNRHRYLTAEQQQAFREQGRQPVVRFMIPEPQTVSWVDLIRGEITWNTQDLGGDMVIARADGQPLYNLAVVVDDIDMGITHIIRGEDHIGNTPKQILLYQALGAELPAFAHCPLILNPEGKKLSKRDGATSVTEFRDLGYLPAALKNYLALLSWSPPDGEELFTLEKAAKLFDFDRVNRSAARFDWDKLNWINSQYIRQLTPAQLVAHLVPFWQAAGYATDQVSPTWLEQLATLIGEGLTKLSDAVPATRFFWVEDLTLSPEAQAQLQQPGVLSALAELSGSLAALDPASSSPADLKALVDQISKNQGLKKGVLMKGLRAALTGEVHGPDLITSFWLLWQRGFAGPRLARLLAST